jgi:hypothetical protein
MTAVLRTSQNRSRSCPDAMGCQVVVANSLRTPAMRLAWEAHGRMLERPEAHAIPRGGSSVLYPASPQTPSKDRRKPCPDQQERHAGVWGAVTCHLIRKTVKFSSVVDDQ